MRTIFISIIVPVLFCSTAAQSLTKIEGYVTTGDGRPVENANVVITGTAIGTATDEQGYFELRNIFAGEYSMVVSHVGYEPEIIENIMVTRDLPVRLTVRLKPYLGTLEDIIVTASKDSTRDSAFTIKLSSDRIRNSPAQTLGGLLRQIPGVDIIEDGSGNAKISIHGGDPNQVLVLLDGVAINDPLTGEADLNLIPLSMIEDVTIHKGGASARSGSGALTGSIEIRSRQSFENRISVDLKAGSFEARGFQGSLSGSFGSLTGMFTYDDQTENRDYPYNYQRLDGTVVSERRRNAGFSAKQFFLKGGYAAGRNQLMLQANLYHSTRGLPGTVYYWTPYATADVTRQLLAAQFIHDGSPVDLTLQLSAYHNESEYRNLWPEEPPPVQDRRVPQYHTKYRVTAYQGDLTARRRWTARNEAVMRLFYRCDLFSDEDLYTESGGPIEQAENRQAGVGLENDWRFPTPGWIDHSSLKLAFRIDDIRSDHVTAQYDETFFSPHIGMHLNHDAVWRISWRINAGRSFRAPTFADLYYQDFRVRGNADLLPEKSLDFDTGIRITLPWIHRPEFEISYFRQDITDMIVWELGSFATWQPSNVDAMLKGWEFGLTWPVWPDHLSLRIHHTDLDALDRSNRRTTHDKYLPYRPGQTTRLGAEIEIGRLGLTYQRRTVSSRFITAANTVSLPGYHVDDLTMNFSFSAGPFDCKVRTMALNFLDIRYEIVRDAPLPGRHWRAGLEIVY